MTFLRLNGEMGVARPRNEVRQRLTEPGVGVADDTPEAFAELIQPDNAKYAKLIREFNLRVD